MEATDHLTPEGLLQHEAFVFALARSLVRDEATAQDVAQDTFLSAMQRPPRAAREGAVRSWLSRVVRNQASNQSRGARRRAEHELGAARGEAVPAGPTASERLELVHKVVTAVLALEEPYKGVVVGIYYEGLTPQQLAQARGIPSGTVRSHLSRALDQLRSKLDREHDGNRNVWSAALTGLLERGGGEAIVTASTGAASSMAVQLTVFGGVLVTAVTLVGWQIMDWDSTPGTGLVAASLQVDPPASEPVTLVSPPQARVEIEPAPEPPATAIPAATASPLDELPAMLERMRQIKAVVLERRLEVPAELQARYSWLADEQGAGVTKLLDRNLFGMEFSLPWMEGGGAYFSVTEGVHDYQRHPQLGLQRGELRSGWYGGYEGAVLDLGPGLFQGLTPGSSKPHGLAEEQAAAWDLLHRVVEDDDESTRWLPNGMRQIGFDDDADIEPGHTYLVRAISPQEFDVLVAVEVAEAGRDECVLAYRLLQSTPVADARRKWTPPESRADLAPPPAELLAASEPQLLGELDALRQRGEKLLLHTFPDELRQRGGRFVRLLERTSPWTEFPAVREGGAYYSFATKSHDYNDHPDISLEGGYLSSGFAGSDTGVVADLGVLSLAEVEAGWRTAQWGPALDLAAGFELPQEDRSTALANLRSRAQALSADYREALLGHGYVLRSIVTDEHDHLVAFEVVAVDDYGVILEWTPLRSWPIEQERTRGR